MPSYGLLWFNHVLSGLYGLIWFNMGEYWNNLMDMPSGKLAKLFSQWDTMEWNKNH